MGTDPYADTPSQNRGITAPLETMTAVTPGTSELTNFPRAIYCGASGHVVIVDMEDNEVELQNLSAGVWHPIRCKKILSTATALGSPAPTTTATNIVAGH